MKLPSQINKSFSFLLFHTTPSSLLWGSFLIGILGMLVGVLILTRSNFNLKTIEKSWLSFKQQTGLLDQSKISVWLEGHKLNLQFEILAEDQVQAQQFFANLGFESVPRDTISLEIDKQTLDNMALIMPTELTVRFLDKSLTFENNATLRLHSSLRSEEFNFATGSGRLVLKTISEKNFNLEVTDPLPLIQYASNSGQIRISQKLDDLLPILLRVDKIKLQVDDKDISGRVDLK